MAIGDELMGMVPRVHAGIGIGCARVGARGASIGVVRASIAQVSGSVDRVDAGVNRGASTTAGTGKGGEYGDQDQPGESPCARGCDPLALLRFWWSLLSPPRQCCASM